MMKFMNKGRSGVIMGLIMAMGIFITSCGENKKAVVNNHESTGAAIVESNNKSQDNSSFYVGAWKINKIVGYGNVCAYSEEDMKKLIGQRVEFSKNQTIYYDMVNDEFKKVSNLSYEEKSETLSQYSQEYKVDASKIGIEVDNMTTIKGKDENNDVVLSLVTDGKKMLMNIGNVYLELVR